MVVPDELTLQNGIILKGHQVVKPDQLRHNILQQLHIPYQGIDKTKKLARESIHWPGISKSIENMCASCSLCQEMQPQQTPQPLQQHERPLAPWVKVRTDIFTINNAAATIRATNECFSLLGIPREIMSNNGPQFLREYNEFCKE